MLWVNHSSDETERIVKVDSRIVSNSFKVFFGFTLFAKIFKCLRESWKLKKL